MIGIQLSAKRRKHTLLHMRLVLLSAIIVIVAQTRVASGQHSGKRSEDSDATRVEIRSKEQFHKAVANAYGYRWNDWFDARAKKRCIDKAILRLEGVRSPRRLKGKNITIPSWRTFLEKLGLSPELIEPTAALHELVSDTQHPGPAPGPEHLVELQRIKQAFEDSPGPKRPRLLSVHLEKGIEFLETYISLAAQAKPEDLTKNAYSKRRLGYENRLSLALCTVVDWAPKNR